MESSSTLTVTRRRVPNPKQIPLQQSTGNDLKVLCADLASDDASVAYAAILALSKAEGSVPHLRGQLPMLERVLKMRTKEIRGLISELNSDKFLVRENASRRLLTMAWFDSHALRQTLDGSRSVEVRKRLKEILDNLSLDNLPEEVRLAHRVIEVLELVGSAEAIAALNEIVALFPPSYHPGNYDNHREPVAAAY